MPLIGTPPALTGIELENRGVSFCRADGRVRHQLSEPEAKALLLAPPPQRRRNQVDLEIGRLR